MGWTVEIADGAVKDVGYIVWMFLGWPIVAAIIAAFLSGGDGQVLLALFFVLVVGGWLVTLPSRPRR